MHTLLTPDQIDDSLRVLQDLFRQLRPRIEAAAGKTEHRDKNDNGYIAPVTDLDIELERTIMHTLARQSAVPVYGEESGYDENQDGTFWLVDPLDGTGSFVKGVPGYTVMAVLIQNQEAVASVIYNPKSDEMYVAQKGKGALKNGERLDLSTLPLPDLAYGRERLLDTINDVVLEGTGVQCEAGPTGAGYGFGLVADGRLAARFNFPHKPGGGHAHDYAPGALLVSEAGGIIIPIENDTYTFRTRSFVACHPKLETAVRHHAKQLHELEIKTA